MLFNSLEFLVFFPVVFIIYFFILKTQNSRLILLFIASCFFYSFLIPAYLAILFLLIVVDFYAGIKIEESTTKGRKKTYLLLSIASNLAILGFFKYFNFFASNINQIAQFFHWNFSLRLLEIILPIGLSFHTFQSLAYIFEVYYGRFKAEKSLLVYSVYVLYFPQLVAGPIERPQNILHQFKEIKFFDYERTIQGLYLVFQGLVKKAVIADSLATLANQVFSEPQQYGMLPTTLGILAFSIQIYCDFSGYSDIARGTSKILGIELMVNFNKPYRALSISEFWKRWHISLSTWFRDYLYIPLGGNRKGKERTYFNLLLVFVVSGFWHGANWTFIIWGALHGVYLLLESTVLKFLGQDQWPKIFQRLFVFILVGITWVFFRANDVPHAMSTLNGLITTPMLGIDRLKYFQIYECLILVGGVFVIESLDEKYSFWATVRSKQMVFRWLVYWVILGFFLMVAPFSGTQFIYFQF